MAETQKVQQNQKPTVAARAETNPSTSMTEIKPLSNAVIEQANRGSIVPHHLLHLQRTIGNQATRRLMQRRTPIQFQPKQSKRYLKRRFIQRNVMPYETWKKASSGSFFSFRPDELEQVDTLLTDYHSTKDTTKLTQIVTILKQYKTDNQAEWKKNKRATSIEQLISQAEATLDMVAKGTNTADLLSVSAFKELTKEEGTFWNAGLSSFQDEIIVKLTEYHQLADPTGADVSVAYSLVVEMDNLADQWIDQYEGSTRKSRENRLQGFKAFKVQLTNLKTTLTGYVAGQIEQVQQPGGQLPQGHQGPVLPPKYKRNTKTRKFVDVGTAGQDIQQETAKETEQLNKNVELKHEGDAKSMFTKLTPLINGLAGNTGEKGEIDIEFKIPIPNASIGVFGAFVGGHFKIGVENEVDAVKQKQAREDAKTKRAAPNADHNAIQEELDKKLREAHYVKLRGDLTFTAGIDFTIGEFKAELGGYMETRGTNSEQSAALLSYAFYRRLMDSSKLEAIAAGIWGGNTGGLGKARAEKWARKVEKDMLSVEDNYAEIGMVGVLGLKANVTDSIEAGVKVQGSFGRRYNKKTMDEKLAFMDDVKKRHQKLRDLQRQVEAGTINQDALKQALETFDDQLYNNRKTDIGKKRAEAIKKLDDKLKKKRLSQENYQLDLDATNQEYDNMEARLEAMNKLRRRQRESGITESSFDKKMGKLMPQGYEDSDWFELKFEVATPFGKFELKYKSRAGDRSTWEVSGTGYVFIGATGAGKIVETVVELIADAIVTQVRKAQFDTEDKNVHGGNLEIPASITGGIAGPISEAMGKSTSGVAAASKEAVTKVGWGAETKKNAFGVTKKSQDNLTDAGGFGLTLKLGKKDDKWYGSISLERVTELSVTAGVFKGKYKKQKRYIGVMFKDGNWGKPSLN